MANCLWSSIPCNLVPRACDPWEGNDYKVFFKKKKNFPEKKHSLGRKLFFEIEDPGRGGVEAWADSKKP
jgi:hypothetical protein